MTMTTQREIARKLKISQMTVSRVLNGSSLVKEKTRKQVLDEIRKSGYSLNVNARNLISKRCGSIGIIIPNYKSIGYMYFYLSLAGINQVMDEENYSITLVNLERHGSPEETMRNYLNKVDGFIVINMSTMRPYISRLIKILQEEEKNCVMIQPHLVKGKPPFPYVTIDNFGAGYKAVQYLHKLGHKRIAFICRGESASIDGEMEERMRGFKTACKDLGIPVKKDWIKIINRDKLPEAVGSIFGDPEDARPTAVFCWSDVEARALIYELKVIGLKVPEDISVVGFDDWNQFTHMTAPFLTTLRQPLYEAGAAAAKKLLLQINGNTDEDKQVILETPLIERDTCRKI